MANSNRPAKRPSDSEADRQFVSALARGLEVLRCFDAGHPELGTMDIAAMTGLPQPTVWRLCYTLVKCGYLVQPARNDKLRPGLGILALGRSAVWELDRREMVLQEMQQIANASGCAVSIAMPDKADMLIIERCTPRSMLIVNLQIGSRLPMASSAMGWAYLAALAEPERRTLLKAAGASRDPARRDIDNAHAMFMKRGYVVNSGRFHPQINAIAAPIVLTDTGRVLAINCGGPASVAPIRTLEREIAPRLVGLARSIASALDGSDLPALKRAQA